MGAHLVKAGEATGLLPFEELPGLLALAPLGNEFEIAVERPGRFFSILQRVADQAEVVPGLGSFLDPERVFEVDLGLLVTFLAKESETPVEDDAEALLWFLDEHQHLEGHGIYLSGDDIAEEWVNTFTSASAADLKSIYMQFDLTSGDQSPTVGIAPLGVGFAGGSRRAMKCLGVDAGDLFLADIHRLA